MASNKNKSYLGDNKKKIVNRLSVIEGQINGVKKMIEDDKNYDDVITQLYAVERSVASLSNIVLQEYLYSNASNLEKENAKLSRMVKELFDVYLEELENNDQDSNIVKFKNKMVENYQNMPNPLIVSDYLSMMTDTYVLNDYERKFLPILHGEKL